MAFSTIQVGSTGGVLTITLNRPAALNAFTAEMSVELGAAIRGAQRDDAVRCVILAGAGRGFCAGQDLRAWTAEPTGGDGRDLGPYVRDRVNPVVARLRAMEKPVIAAINGVAAGFGASLALAADLRVAARSAVFKMAFGQIGLAPDGGATLTLVQLVGYGRAAELCLLNEPVSAEQAAAMGLVNRLVADEVLPDAAAELAARLAALPRLAVALTKRALNRAWTAALEDQLEYEAHLQSTLGRTADHREGVAAFLEKRPPRFESG